MRRTRPHLRSPGPGRESEGRFTKTMAAGLVVLGLVAGLLVACGGSNDDDTAAGRGSGGSGSASTEQRDEPTTAAPSTTTTEPSTTTAPTTTAPSTTTTSAPPPPPPGPEADGMLKPGENGQAVLRLQQRLVELGYWLGNPDSGYGDLTRQAVLAFQKAEGLGRDGVAGPQTLSRLETAQRPQGRSTSGNLIEIDLSRQLLMVIENGRVVWAFNTSSGKPSTPTPPGRFTISRQIDGYRRSRLGLLYRPKYFNGGIALHGYTSVPAYAASHGCTRVSNPAIDYLWSTNYANVGTQVWVY